MTIVTTPDRVSWLELARVVDPVQADAQMQRFASLRDRSDATFAAAVLCSVVFPPCLSVYDQDLKRLEDVTDPVSLSINHDKRRYEALIRATEPSDLDERARHLRRFARQHRMRIAMREVLPPGLGGADFETTAREISELASATVEVAIDIARREVSARFGQPVRDDKQPSTFVVLGMGKLGGYELNAGSDIDLIFAYDTDEGSARDSKGDETLSLHEYWSRVGRRLSGILSDVCDDGLVWRVDLRLRPEGGKGPITNSMSAMLHYYETWGRLWERAAMLRARPIAGDIDLGNALLRELQSFIYRRSVEPAIAQDMIALGDRARLELSSDASRDLKLGAGGIRDIELFVQTLQLIWGGVEPTLRKVRSTTEALRTLRGCGLVTDGEARDLDSAYILLRRAEHMVQNTTGLQTHLLPVSVEEREKLARCLGYANLEGFEQDLAVCRARARTCLLSLSPEHTEPTHFDALLAAVDNQDVELVERLLTDVSGALASREMARDIVTLGSRPDALLGAVTREKNPGTAEVLLEALLEAADPEQAARALRTFFGRVAATSIYVSILASNIMAARRFITALGASAFVADFVVRRPDLDDQVLFSQGMPSIERAGQETRREIASLPADRRDDPDAFVGALRRAKLRTTMEIALADVAGEVGLREPSQVLTALADSQIEAALRFASGDAGPSADFCVVGVGKLGGRELGYGSDLDVFFVFDPDPRGEGRREDPDDFTRHIRLAQKTMRHLSMTHAEGPGYELDTRLRPSGSQGVLVTSLPSFAKYHGLSIDGEKLEAGGTAAAWERQTLVRARACAGDMACAERVLKVAQIAAYELGEPDPKETHRLRTRLEQELGKERDGRYNLKLGRGGLVDIEFAVQVLQMRHGKDNRVRCTGTLEAIEAIEQAGYLNANDANTLREGYRFLRRLEQRLHIVHATSIHLIEAQAPGLLPLARRMGFRDHPTRSAAGQLMDRYLEVTRGVRTAYLEVLGIGEG